MKMEADRKRNDYKDMKREYEVIDHELESMKLADKEQQCKDEQYRAPQVNQKSEIMESVVPINFVIHRHFKRHVH
jgi:hypothetical protein